MTVPLARSFPTRLLPPPIRASRKPVPPARNGLAPTAAATPLPKKSTAPSPPRILCWNMSKEQTLVDYSPQNPFVFFFVYLRSKRPCHRVKHELLIFALVMMLSSCGVRHARLVMNEVETYLKDAPDSARMALQSLPSRSVWLPWQRAKYCLLLSSALDRSGIDVQDDSLARYAADYYSHFGGPVNRFYSQYYLGRVHENRGDRQSAMEAFVKAESIHSKTVPFRFRCGLALHMGALYSQIYERDKAIEANFTAAEFARKAEWWDAYGEALLKNETFFVSEGLWGQADSCRFRLDSIQASLPIWLVLKMRGNDSRRLLGEGVASDRIWHFNDSVIVAFEETPELIPWEFLSTTYVRSGNPQKALDAIHQYSYYNDTKANSIYYGILSEVLDSLKDVGNSLEAYKRYQELSDSLDLIIFNQDTKFLKERYALQTLSTQRKTIIWIVVSLSVFVLAGMAAFMVKRKKERKYLESLYADLKEEYDDLQSLPRRKDRLSQEATKLLGSRVKALAAFFTKDPPKSLSQVSTQLETLAENRKELLETIGMLFAVYCPEFVLQLVESDLSPAEIGYSCLIALGLRNGEMKDVINREGVNNINSTIRRKLGIGLNSSKLGTVLRDMYGDTIRE